MRTYREARYRKAVRDHKGKVTVYRLSVTAPRGVGLARETVSVTEKSGAMGPTGVRSCRNFETSGTPDGTRSEKIAFSTADRFSRIFSLVPGDA